MDLTLDDLKKTLAEATAEAIATSMKSAEHEQQAAEQRGVGDDPLTEERISKMVDEQVTKKTAELEKAYEEKMVQRLAEFGRVDPDAAKHGIADTWPLPYNELVNPPQNEQQKAAQHVSDALYVIAKYAEKPIEAARAYLHANGLDKDNVIVKAMDTSTNAQGVDWVPTYFSAQMIANVDAAARVAPVFARIPMAGAHITIPGGSGIPQVYRGTGAENTEVTEATLPQSVSVTLDAEELRCYRGFSTSLDEDSIVSVANYLLGRMAYAFARAIDKAILDGDTAENGIDGVVASTSYLRAWDGLRKKCLSDAGSTVDLSTFVVDNLVQLPAAMGEYADDVGNLVWLVPSAVYWKKLFTLKDAAGNPAFLPATNQAPAVNPIITGQVGYLLGIPVVPSGLMRTDLNATGHYDGSTTTKSIVHLVNRNAWVLGDRRELTVETGRNILAGTNQIVMTWRGDFIHLYGTALTTMMGYNIS